MPPVFFREEGSGPPLVFLHGFCDSNELWSDFIRPFISKYRVLTPDLPGFGKSDSIQAPFTLDQVADSMAEWMEEKILNESIVIGHSLGGYIALAVLAKYPELVSGLCLFHSTPYADSEERKKVRKKVVEFVHKNGVKPFLENFIPGLFLDKADPHISEALFRSSATTPGALIGYSEAMRGRPDRSALLLQSNLPVLLIGGTSDSLIPIESLQKLSKKSENFVFHELPNVGHMGIFEAKMQCQGIISRFAESVSSRADI